MFLQEIELLVAWRDGLITHLQVIYSASIQCETLDRFEMPDSVPILQVVKESEHLYLAMGSDTFMLRYCLQSRRFVRQSILLPGTRLAAPILIPHHTER